jgi:phage tail sheath protein FI
MPTYETPGVYDERSDASGGGIAALRTDVTGFAGIAERGPLHLAVPVESTRQFEAWFGRPIDQGYLAYSARAFFENGGRRLWVVRVASDAAAAAAVIVSAAGAPAWRIEASTPGVWGNAVAVRLRERRAIQRRGRVDPLDARLVHVGNTAGLGPWTLVEVRAGSIRERAVVQAAEPGLGTLRLDRTLTGINVNTSIAVDSVSYALDVWERGELVAQFADLSMIPRHPRYAPAVLRLPWTVLDPDRPDQPTGLIAEPDLAVEYFRVRSNREAVGAPPVVIRELRDEPARVALDLFDPLAVGPTLLVGGADGLAALRVSDFVGEAVSPGASSESNVRGRRGIAALGIVDEIALVAVPDIHIRPRPMHRLQPPPACEPDPCLPGAPTGIEPVVQPVGDSPPTFGLDAIAMVQSALINQCERLRDRVAVLDAPFETCDRLTFAATELRAWRMRFDSAFAGLYAPWVRVVDPLRTRVRTGSELTRSIPPSGHVCGQAAAIDLRAGVHVASANAPLQSIQALTLVFDDALHGLLNSSGINALRAQPGRGLRVLGGRTVSSDPDWRYLSVRRLMSMIEKAIDVSLQWAVFEPNDWATRAKIAMVIQSFLLELWSRGAMVGAVPEQGFWVRCDDTNNPGYVRDQGRLQVDVGIAPTTPFEFIVLRIGRDANGFAMSEGEPLQAAG